MTKVGVLLGGDEKSTEIQMNDVLNFEEQLAEVISYHVNLIIIIIINY